MAFPPIPSALRSALPSGASEHQSLPVPGGGGGGELDHRRHHHHRTAVNEHFKLEIHGVAPVHWPSEGTLISLTFSLMKSLDFCPICS